MSTQWIIMLCVALSGIGLGVGLWIGYGLGYISGRAKGNREATTRVRFAADESFRTYLRETNDVRL